MRVVHLVKTSRGARWALEQVGELARMGIDVHVVLPRRGPRSDQYADANCSVHYANTDLATISRRSLPSALRQIRELVDDIDPDLVHSHFLGTTLAWRLARGGRPIPTIFQVPGPLHMDSAVFRRLDRTTASKHDYWIGSCRHTVAQYVRSGVSPSRVWLSYYGTDISSFGRGSPDRMATVLGARQTPETIVVGMVAYMYAPKQYLGQRQGLKGHEDFIAAIELASRFEPRLLGVMVGGAWEGADTYAAKIMSRVESSPAPLVALGSRDDVADLYLGMDLAVVPSHSENLGGAAEAMLSGVPVLASSVGGLPDLVIHGRTGWLTRPAHPTRLANDIAGLASMRSEWAAVAEQGRLRARHLLDVRRTSAEIADIYGDVVAAAAARGLHGRSPDGQRRRPPGR